MQYYKDKSYLDEYIEVFLCNPVFENSLDLLLFVLTIWYPNEHRWKKNQNRDICIDVKMQYHVDYGFWTKDMLNFWLSGYV